MKRSINALIAVVVLSASLLFIAAKNGAITGSDLDRAGVNGGGVFYQLTDEERLITDESGSFGLKGQPYLFADGTEATKVPAEIIFDFFDRRRPTEEGGQRVYSVLVKRAGFLGGPFVKNEVHFDSARQPGTIDRYKPGDLVN